MPWAYIINDLNREEIVTKELFTKKNSKKRIKESLELKYQSKEKLINYILNGKDTKLRLIAG